MARYSAVIVAALCALLSAQSQRDRASLLTTGTFHGDEVHARTGEKWLGLFKARSGFVWRAVTLTTRRVNDPVGDEPREKTGIEVRVAGGEPVLLTKGIAGLLGTKVRSVIHSPEGLSLPERDALELNLPGGAACRLRVVDKRLSDDSPEKPSRLVLESEGLSQVLYEWPNGLLDQHCEWYGQATSTAMGDSIFFWS